MSAEGSRLERLLQDVVDGGVCAFAGWTAGYQLGFLLRLPAAVDAAVGLLLAIAAVALLLHWRGRQPGLTRAGRATSAVVAVLVLCAAVAVLSTLMNRPDADDITFFPRAVAQLAQLDSPILTGEVTSDVRDLPGASIGYLLTSYEFLVALMARGLGLDPLAVYHNAAGALGSALVPAVYYLLLRRLGLAPLLALAGVSGAVAFLLLDGDDHRSMGNLAFVRLWQGKAILLTLLPPYVLTHTVAYLSEGGRRSWLCLVLAGVGATGLSTIGGFFAPAMIVTAAVAVGGGLLVTRQAGAGVVLRRGALLAGALIWPAGILLVTLAAPLAGTVSPLDVGRLAARHDDERMVLTRWDGWGQALLLPAGGPVRAVWALVTVAVAPFLALERRRAVLVAALIPVFLLFVANPVGGPLLYDAVPEVFWRFAFLLPVPLCAGLVVAALVRAASRDVHPRIRTARAVASVALIGVFALTVGMTTMSPGNVGFGWKESGAWKLDGQVLASLDPWLEQISGRRVLADEQAAVALALADPSVRVVAHRPAVTLASFALADRYDEGAARLDAQALVAAAGAGEDDRAAFRQVVDGHVDVVVVRAAADGLVADLLGSDPVWRRLGGDATYSVWVRAQ